MSEPKIYANLDGTLTTVQNFQIEGENYYIINRGPYRVEEISRLHMKLRKLRHLKNPGNGIWYEVRKA